MSKLVIFQFLVLFTYEVNTEMYPECKEISTLENFTFDKELKHFRNVCLEDYCSSTFIANFCRFANPRNEKNFYSEVTWLISNNDSVISRTTIDLKAQASQENIGFFDAVRSGEAGGCVSSLDVYEREIVKTWPHFDRYDVTVMLANEGRLEVCSMRDIEIKEKEIAKPKLPVRENKTSPQIKQKKPTPTESTVNHPTSTEKIQHQTNDDHDKCFHFKAITFMLVAMIACILIVVCYSFKRFQRENGLLRSQIQSYSKLPQQSPQHSSDSPRLTNADSRKNTEPVIQNNELNYVKMKISSGYSSDQEEDAIYETLDPATNVRNKKLNDGGKPNKPLIFNSRTMWK